jgi:hypothetical protein
MGGTRMKVVTTYLPWLLSAITIWMTLLAGNQHPKAWLVGLANQALWLVWILATGTWGLIPLNVALWVVYGRNHWMWNKSEKQLEFPPIDLGTVEGTK